MPKTAIDSPNNLDIFLKCLVHKCLRESEPTAGNVFPTILPKHIRMYFSYSLADGR